MAKFKAGHFYTRRQIHRRIGGGLRDSLPHRDGKVLCGAFTLERNPAAPRVVLVGRGTRLERWAEVLAGQAEAVPVFLKRSPLRWEYVGDYRVGRKSTGRADIARHAARPSRSDLSMVLFLRRSGGGRAKAAPKKRPPALGSARAP